MPFRRPGRQLHGHISPRPSTRNASLRSTGPPSCPRSSGSATARLCLYARSGLGRSKLAEAPPTRNKGVVATSRNWNTVAKSWRN
ncbi:hypothetical protein STENM223S_02447 [Streptomyces tendae]